MNCDTSQSKARGVPVSENHTSESNKTLEVVDEDDLMIITNQGTMIRQPVSTINVIGRNTQGVRLIKLKENATIASVTKVIQEEEVERSEDARES